MGNWCACITNLRVCAPHAAEGLANIRTVRFCGHPATSTKTTRHQGQKESTHPQKVWCLPATSTSTTRHQGRNTRMNVPQALYKIIIVILLIVCLLLLLSILFSHYGSTIPAEGKLWIRKCARPKKKENNWTHASFMMF